jgi:threonine aldolase
MVALAASSAPVIASGDGIPLSPVAYAELLQKLAGGIAADNYGLGGVVEKLEAHMAAELGKEMAVWFPTGTLANHMAVRTLAGDRKRVLVQAESHLYNDCGDCCQTLSGLNLIPLAPGRATFTLDEVKEMANRSATGRVKTPVGAIMIESPVRRKTGEAFDLMEMKKISGWARTEGVGLHLDGARLYMAAAYSGLSVRDYANLFDTVYVSMYKYFGAASGAILAGPKKLLTDLFHARRMFGGGQHEAWLRATAPEILSRLRS